MTMAVRATLSKVKAQCCSCSSEFGKVVNASLCSKNSCALVEPFRCLLDHHQFTHSTCAKFKIV